MANIPHLQLHQPQSQTQQPQSNPFMNFVPIDPQIFATSTLPNPSTPYVHVMGIAPAGEGAVVEGWEPSRKRVKEQVFLEGSQISSIDFLHTGGSVSTGLGLSLDDRRVGVSSGESSLVLSSIDEEIGRDIQRQDAEMDRFLKLQAMFPRGADIRLVSSHPEVYEPCDDSFALVDALLADRGNLVNHQARFCMEIGCGSGYVITSLAIILGKENSGIHYFTSDINPHATRVTQSTIDAHGVHAEIINTDIASGLQKRLVGMMDVIVVNPPYVPTPEEEVSCEGITASWAGGYNGRTVIDRILPVVDELLSGTGWLYMVTLTANNPSEICLVMRRKGYASRIVLQRSTEEESLHVIKFWREGADDVWDKDIKSSSLGLGSWFGK